jgi:heptosyltransferase-2
MAEEFARILASAAGFAHDGFRESSISLLRPENFPPLASPLALSSDFAHTIALVPGGAKNILRDDALRRWPVENYAAVAQLLIARGHRVILTGAPDDAWTLPAFQPLLASHPHALLNRIGSTSLPELLALYDSCSLVITHDTGSMHIAGISRAAVLAIFGPTNPANVLPRRDRVKALWGGATLPCRPCFDGRNFAPCSFNGCVREITPAHVAAEAEAMLSARAFSS